MKATKKSYVVFGYKAKVKINGVPNWYDLGLFQSKWDAQKYINKHYPGTKNHIELFRLDSTPIDISKKS